MEEIINRLPYISKREITILVTSPIIIVDNGKIEEVCEIINCRISLPEYIIFLKSKKPEMRIVLENSLRYINFEDFIQEVSKLLEEYLNDLCLYFETRKFIVELIGYSAIVKGKNKPFKYFPTFLVLEYIEREKALTKQISYLLNSPKVETVHALFGAVHLCHLEKGIRNARFLRINMIIRYKVYDISFIKEAEPYNSFDIALIEAYKNNTHPLDFAKRYINEIKELLIYGIISYSLQYDNRYSFLESLCLAQDILRYLKTTEKYRKVEEKLESYADKVRKLGFEHEDIIYTKAATDIMDNIKALKEFKKYVDGYFRYLESLRKNAIKEILSKYE